MSDQSDDRSLSMMNAAVSLVLLIPLLLLLLAQQRNSQEILRRLKDKDGQRTMMPSGASKSHRGELLDQPPVITISEAQVFSFASGDAELSPEFKRYISSTVVPRLLEMAASYSCDVIEVIGHTDAQPVRAASNLDAALLRALQEGSTQLSPGSNLDLGFMRAWAVIRALRLDGRLGGKVYYAYSAGQSILPSGNIATPQTQPRPEADRRRIEIRLRRHK